MKRSTETLVLFLAFVWSAAACSALQSITPADRAKAYGAAAAGVKAECKAYRFDRAAGLVPEVPAMSELCDE